LPKILVDATKSHIAADSNEVKDTVGLTMKQQNIMHFNNVSLLKYDSLIAGIEHDRESISDVNTPRTVTKIVLQRLPTKK
jgi:hypothetical protein